MVALVVIGPMWTCAPAVTGETIAKWLERVPRRLLYNEAGLRYRMRD